MIYLLLAINITLLVLGQMLWKIGVSGRSVDFTFSGILKLLATPYIFGGFLTYAAATVIWLYILSKSELSFIYPLQSLCYAAAAFIGLYFFKEHISLTRWLGIAFIVLGAYFVSLK